MNVCAIYGFIFGLALASCSEMDPVVTADGMVLFTCSNPQNVVPAAFFFISIEFIGMFFSILKHWS